MSTQYGYWKQVTSMMAYPRQALGILLGMLRVCLGYAKGLPRVCLRYACSMLLLLLLTVGTGSVWGQDYSGVWYIASVGYNAGTPANNYYLCPTEGWCYYQATNDFTGTDNGMPFLTTYKCRSAAYHSGNPNDAIWIIEKAPAPNSSYYYIRQASTGKYLTSNGTIQTTGNADRMRIHLEAVAPENLDDKELFTITEYNTYLTISPKGVVGGAADRNWLTVNGGNKDSLKGASGKTGGPTGYANTAGIVGVYTQNDANAPFYLEKALSIDAPTITNNYDGTITITAASGATIYYTTNGDRPTTESYTGTGTTSVNVNQTESMTVIKAIAKATSDPFPTNVTTYYLPVCERPVISVSGSTVTITCTTEGATIYYTTDGSPATSDSPVYTEPFAKGDASTFRAIATKTGYVTSSEAILLPPTEVSSSSQITNMNGSYILASDFTSSGSIGTADNPFKGIINGNLNTLTLGVYPLVAYADGATIKNVILDNVNISSGNENGNAGAICCEATGDTRIYNCGVLSGSVGGSEKVGGIVGLLDGRARVINCYNYADITSGSDCGGIVGYNNVASTSNNIQTMVMNCMNYGSVTGGNAAPIYGGAIIHNKYASADDTGLNNYCYFLYDEEKVPYVKTIADDKYNGALGAEERFLNRFEFFRMTLNSTRNLAAFYVTGDANQKDEMAKWVLDKSIAPYPILKPQAKYPSVVNTDAAHATAQTERNKGGLLGTLNVTIGGVGGGAQFTAPSGASITTSSLTLNITDKDFDNFNFNYRKVQLPYYNEVGTGNYTKASDGTGRVVTGWKITSITGGTPGSFTTNTYDYPSFNYVDRKCTNKDLYGTGGSNRVFAQGAYWEVPDGVTAITIEPYWAKAVYLSDANYDVTYYINVSGSSATANKYGVTVCGSCPTTVNGQTVYNDIASATNNLGSNASHTVYDYAVVLVGNYHQAANNAIVNIGAPVTFMSADLDGDNEPDNTLFYYHNQRKRVSEIRFDFLNIPGIGMVKRTHDATTAPEPGIFKPQGWFEITNTVLIHCGQFEYAAGSSGMDKTILAPLILQGGVYEQFVSGMDAAAKNTNYILIGSNAWFKNFANGCHTKNAQKTPKVPINVAGGDYTNFYLTGIYQPAADQNAENAECYIDGGRFSEVAGSGMQQVKGDVTWLINAADITSFYGGGINAAKPITGSISTTISNSYVDEFYGGPKFGDMSNEKTVVTNATSCHFGKFFGAGYGGTAYNRVDCVDDNKVDNSRDWDGYVDTYYKRAYNANNGGISTNYEYEFIPHSDGRQTVARFFVNYASLSLASTRNVTSTLSGCTIGTFYGGGSLGAVNGDVNSTLTNCTVTGSAFGAGYSASVPTVEVWNKSAYLEPNPTYNRTANVYNNANVKTPKDKGQFIEYTWSKEHGTNDKPFTDTEDGKHYIHTDVSLEGLGAVTGTATLTINGTTTVAESVYGGGEESAVNGDTHVTISGGAVNQSVYGGGCEADVKGNTNVSMTDGYIFNGIFGGGLSGSVGTFTRSTAAADVNIFGHTAHEGCIGKPVSCADGTGKCTIVVSGGQIGPIEVATQGMNRLAKDGGPVPEGWVWGAGRGLVEDPATHPDTHFTAYVNETDVTIKDGAFVLESIIGGGEFGRVLGNTKVKIEGGQIGVGANQTEEGKPKRYSDDKFVDPSEITITDDNALAPCSHYPYGKEVGGVTVYETYDPYADEYKEVHGALPEGLEGGSTDAPSDGKTWIGCVFGGGSGYFPYKTTDAEGNITGYGWVESAGWVEGDAEVIISGGHILSNVYGANEYTTVQGKSTVTMTGGTIGVPRTQAQIGVDPKIGHLFGGGKGDPRPYFKNKTNAGSVEVAVSGGIVYGSVFGGGESGTVKGGVTVTMTGGSVLSDVYGGGALADTQTNNWDASANDGAGDWAEGKTSASNTTLVRLTGGDILGEAYGGGLGETGSPAYVYGDVLLDLNGTTTSGEEGTAIAATERGCAVNQVFGCNNAAGTPMGDVLVHVYATQNKTKSQIGNTDGETPVTDAKVKGSYDVTAVYGGGNLAAYEPAGGKETTNSTNVIIDGCELTSIQTVYGGGNAASTPATNVIVNGTFEIEELFGGGNGKDKLSDGRPNPGANVGYKNYTIYKKVNDEWVAEDDPAYDTKEERTAPSSAIVYGTGQASVNIFGGTVHRVFGGSNTKGNVRQTAVTLLDENSGCDFCVDEAYGGGKSAPMDAEAKLLMACIPGLKAAYGGAEAAAIKGNVTLNITNGTFDRVFGGNNLSGTIDGSITVNIQEVSCRPIIIGELYGGGNQAGYSVYGYNDDGTPKESGLKLYDDPQVNVMSFTSIGKVFGGGYGEGATMVGNPTVNVNEVYGRYYNDDRSIVGEDEETPNGYPIPSHAKGKMGAIHTVFGGGNAAKVIGNATVNIANLSDVYVMTQVTAGDDVTGLYTRNDDGTYSEATGTASADVTYYEKKAVLGVDIRDNVYGGGNNAEVTGDANVNIGKRSE